MRTPEWTQEYVDYLNEREKDMGVSKQQTGLDPVDKKELKGKHADREDPDIDNDGDVDKSDKYLHNRRKKVSKEIQKKRRRAAAVDGAIKSITQSYEPEGEDLEEWEYGKKFVKDPGGETEKLIGKTAEWSGQNVGKAVKFGKGIAKKFISGYKKASAKKDKKKSLGAKGRQDKLAPYPSRSKRASRAVDHYQPDSEWAESIEDSYDAARGAEESYCRYYDGTIIDETMSVHLKPHRNGTHYVVHKVGSKLKRHGGLKVGEKISDTEVDDLGDVGVKVKHMNEEVIMYGVMEGIKVVPTEYDPSEDMEGVEMTEETAADRYATFITGQLHRADPLNPLNSMTEKAKAGEKIGGGTWYGRRKNVSGTKEEDDEIDKEMDAGRAERTKAWKDKMAKDGYKPWTGETEAEKNRIQAEPSKDDPKPWVRTKGMERPWRKDKKPLPMGDVAKEYNKKYPNAAKSRQIDLDNRLRDREGGNVDEPGSPNTGEKNSWAVQQGRSGKKKTPAPRDKAPRRTTRGGTPTPSKPKKGGADIDIQDSANAADKYAAFISNQISAAGPSNQREYEYHPAEFVDESSVESYGIHQDVVKHMEKDGKDPNHAGDYGTYSDHHHMKRGFTHKQYGGHGSFSYSKGPGAGQKLESDPDVAKTDPS